MNKAKRKKKSKRKTKYKIEKIMENKYTLNSKNEQIKGKKNIKKPKN